MKALRKSAAFYIAPISSVCSLDLYSIALLLTFIVTCKFMCSTSVFKIESQFYLIFNKVITLFNFKLRGANLSLGTGIHLYSIFIPRSLIYTLSNSISFDSFFIVLNLVKYLLSSSVSSIFSSTPLKISLSTFTH
jgi:hypothetical protein